jgi:FixJ family two-component response regulator
MSLTTPLVAVLDDEANMRIALRRLLTLRGYEVVLFKTGGDLLESCANRRIDCNILDLHMPEMNGFEVLEKLAGHSSPPPVIVITGHDQGGNEERVRSLGACAYFTKPVDQEHLLGCLSATLGGPTGGSS